MMTKKTEEEVRLLEKVEQHSRVYEKWADSKYLEGLPKNQAVKMAQLFENQTKVMKQPLPPILKSLSGKQARIDKMNAYSDDFKEMALGVIAYAYRKHFEDNLVDFQPMSLPCDRLFYWSEETLRSREVVAQMRRLKLRWDPNVGKDLHACNYSEEDRKKETIAMLGQYLYWDQSREILTDLIQHADRVECKKEAVVSVIRTILREKKESDFIATSPDVAHFLENESFNARLIVDPFFPIYNVLIGCRTESFAKGYVYGPHVPLIKTVCIYDPDDFTSRRSFMSRYSKQMFDASRYTFIKIVDF